MAGDAARFIVCQIGAREHYALARTLYRSGQLAQLITDLWVRPGSPFNYLPGLAGERLRGRYHLDLKEAPVAHFTKSAMGRELRTLITRETTKWGELINQNEWFQAKAVRHLRGALHITSTAPVVIAYSYAAREIFREARKAGAMTVLAQIDGGEVDETLISAAWGRRDKSMPNKAPASYWLSWREECDLADRIMVNSQWSRRLLVEAGIDEAKLQLVPVIYEHTNTDPQVTHRYPKLFDESRPLRVLFLGALTLRKGIYETLAAARSLEALPVEFTLVGGNSDNISPDEFFSTNVTRYDRVPRNRVQKFFRETDVFLFPTHSDGFGMTQIEALESGLPVIASRNCAHIVQHKRTGLLLDEVSVDAVVQAILYCLDHPDRLAEMSASAIASGASIAKQSAGLFLHAMKNFVAHGRLESL